MTATIKIHNGDWAFSSATGRPVLIEGREKFSQDVRENLESDVQVDGTGADLEGVIGTVGDAFSLRAEISRRVSDSFESLRAVQNSIQKFDRTRSEKVSQVVRVHVAPIRKPGESLVSNTTFALRVDVLSEEAALGPVSFNAVIQQ